VGYREVQRGEGGEWKIKKDWVGEGLGFEKPANGKDSFPTTRPQGLRFLKGIKKSGQKSLRGSEEGKGGGVRARWGWRGAPSPGHYEQIQALERTERKKREGPRGLVGAGLKCISR